MVILNVVLILMYLFSGISIVFLGRDSVVGIATRNGLDGPATESRCGAEGARFSVQTGTGALPASCKTGGKLAGAWQPSIAF
jgi:hypothetical protein